MATASVLRAIVEVTGAEAGAAKLSAFGARVDSTARKSGGSLTKMQVAGDLAFAGIGAAAVVGIGKAVDATVNLGTETLKMSRQLGLSAQDASRLISVGHDLGVGFDQLSTGFGIFEKHLVDGGKQFEKYGISVQNADGSQKSFNEVLAEAADKYVSLGGGVQGTAFAMDVFGRSGKSLLPILAQGSAGIAELSKKSDELGTTMSGKDVQASFQLARSQRELQQAFLGVEVSIGKAVIPILTPLVHGLTDVLMVVDKIPGPVKAAGLAFVGFVGVIKGLTLAKSLISGAFAELRGGFVKAGKAKDDFAGNVTGRLVPAAEAGAEAVGAGAAGLTGFAAVAAGVAVSLPALAAVWYAWKVRGLDPANVAMAKATANSKGVIEGVDGQRHAVGGIISTFQGWHAAQAQNVLGEDKLTHSVRVNTDALKNQVGTAQSTADAINALAKMSHMSANQVFKDWILAGKGAWQAGRQVQTLHTQIVALPNGKKVVITVPTYAETVAELRRIHSEITAIPTQYGIYFTVHGLNGQVRGATGGMFRMADGGSAPVMELTRPRMILPNVQAGEGGREFVLPANQRGAMWIKDAVREGLSEGVAQLADILSMGNGGGDVYMDGYRVGTVLKQGMAKQGYGT